MKIRWLVKVMQLNGGGGRKKKKGEMQFGFARRESLREGETLSSRISLAHSHPRTVSAIKCYSPHEDRVRRYSGVLEMHSALNAGIQIPA